MSDDELIKSDPLMGTIQPGGFVSEEPPDVTEFLNNIGITEKQYVCTIKKAPLEGSAAKTFLPGNYKGNYPEVDDIGRRFGPGQYFYCFAWTAPEPSTGKQKKYMKEYKIYLGSEWDEEHDIYMANKWKKGQENIIKAANQKKMQDAARGILPGEAGGKTDPIEDLRKTMGVLKDLGVPMGGNVPANTNNNDSVSMMALMMNMQQKQSEAQAENNKNSMNMFMTMNQNMMTMMMGLMTNNKPQSNNDMMGEMFGMFKGMINMKEMLNPEKQSMVDRLFGIAESALPAIMAIAQKPKEQRMNDPMVNMVRNSDDFKNVANDPASLNEMIRKWDDSHGAEKTDVILETVGLRRPGSDAPVEEPIITPAPETPDSADFEDVNPDDTDINGNPID